MPSYDGRIQGRVKPKGLPEVGQVVTASITGSQKQKVHSRNNINTPYRLPKLYSSETSRAVSVASSHDTAFQRQTPSHQKKTELPSMSGSPLKVPLKASFDYPRLTHAIIAPKTAVTFTRSGKPKVLRSGTPRSLHTFSRHSVRPQTALSDTGSIHWTLGTVKSVHFDKTVSFSSIPSQFGKIKTPRTILSRIHKDVCGSTELDENEI